MKSSVRTLVVSAVVLTAIASKASAMGEYFERFLVINERVGAVDSSAVATLKTFFGGDALNAQIFGTHFIRDAAGFAIAGGPWSGIFEHNSYIRGDAQPDQCYRARFTGRHAGGSANFDIGSSLACFSAHDPTCECGPGTGVPCVLILEGGDLEP
jgi:hypothetical protein